MDPQNQRESFGSRLGFILVSAGCAIGIGNVWRFPTVTGQCGGGIFVLFYLLFLVLMGLPILTMELAVGRAGRGAARSAYKALEPGGSKWHIHGWFCMAGCVLLMMYYTTVDVYKRQGGQLAVLPDVLEEGRHVAGTPLGGGVQGDAHQLMVDERVVEAVLHSGGELLAVLLIQRQDGHDLVQQHLVQDVYKRQLLSF